MGGILRGRGRIIEMHLVDIDIRPRYVSGADDIARDFLVPCLRAATEYRRASGYFSSAVLALSWIGVRDLYLRGGKMRVVCSPSLSLSDVEALSLAVSGPSRQDQEAALLDDLHRMLSDDALCDPARALAAMIVAGFLEVKIAVPNSAPAESPARRIFHQKTGIFSDDRGNAVAFTGSMNETWMGLYRFGNIESIQVFSSWHDERDAMRVHLEEKDFESLWDDAFGGVSVQPLSDSMVKTLRMINSGTGVEDAIVSLASAELFHMTPPGLPYKLRKHQSDVLESWKAGGYRGVVKHATGSGKTITAIHSIRSSSESSNVALILVPSRLLLRQWEGELSKYGPAGARILLCGDGNSEWRKPGVLEAWTVKSDRFRIVLATLATASKEEFLSRLQVGSHVLLVADEAHRLGSEQAQELLNMDVGRALALSATPERAGDSLGTERIMHFFCRILTPVYGIEHAIRDGVLTPYYYDATVVTLNEQEQANWDRLSAQIARLAAQQDPSEASTNLLRKRLIERAQISKQAAAKIPAATEILRTEYEPGQRWIVYCDTVEQVYALTNCIRGLGIDAYVYFSAMAGNKEATLEYFTSVGGVIVSIRCLDEGVDIPSASHALILASSRNPREFVQRRGRVLRRFPGKDIAHIYDLIVAPNGSNASTNTNSAGPLAAEVARAAEFATHSMNPGIASKLEIIATRYGLEWDELQTKGFEVDDEEDGEG